MYEIVELTVEEATELRDKLELVEDAEEILPDRVNDEGIGLEPLYDA